MSVKRNDNVAVVAQKEPRQELAAAYKTFYSLLFLYLSPSLSICLYSSLSLALFVGVRITINKL